MADRRNTTQSSPGSPKEFVSTTHVGLFVIMIVSVVAATLITFRFPDEANKDARNGLLGIVSTIITGSFALFQTTQQSSSNESRNKMEELQQQLNAMQKQITPGVDDTVEHDPIDGNKQLGNG